MARPPPKKRLRTSKNQPAVEEITFDDSARQEYLTGFHKRKVQRTKHAQEVAEKKAREEKLRDRRKLREERKADLERHVNEVNALIRADDERIATNNSANGVESEDEDGWTGITDPKPPPVDHEAEYIDEEKYTTVRVEEMDVTKDGFLNSAEDSEDSSDDDVGADGGEASERVGSETKTSSSGKRIWTREKPKDTVKKPRKKKRNFRYESKAERKFSRAKQRVKNAEQAKARRGD